jgi:tRNA(Ile)-lysidine synthase
LAERKEQKLKEGTALKLDALKKETPFMQELIIFRFLREMMGRTGDVYRKNVTALRTLLDSKGTKKTIIGTFTFEKNYDKIIFSPKKSSLEGEKRIIPVRVYKFGDFTLKSGFSSGKSSKNNILLLPEIAYNLRVRSMQPGDRIKTKTGTKKISDVFTDAKVNANERKSWPIVVMGNELVWVPLLTAYEKAISESKDKVLIIEVQK